MTANRTPTEGQLYLSPSGRPGLYVRTEKRPGCAEPEHLIVETRDRIVVERWFRELPAELELGYDPGAVARADRLAEELLASARKVDALTAALRRAVQAVPSVVGDELRRVYREAVAS